MARALLDVCGILHPLKLLPLAEGPLLHLGVASGSLMLIEKTRARRVSRVGRANDRLRRRVDDRLRIDPIDLHDDGVVTQNSLHRRAPSFGAARLAHR